MLNAFFLKSKLLRMSGILLVILSFCIPAFSASLEALGIEQKKVTVNGVVLDLSLIHISEPTRQAEISYAVFCLKKKKKKNYSSILD